jgi:signal transduction histidine kinase
LRIAGIGLGLATVREIAHAHGGDVAVESRPGVGSRFTLQLPGFY